MDKVTTESGADRSAHKRATILEAARAVFLSKGYAGASMDEIAARAAVSKPTVYKNFGDKQALFAAIITSDISDAEERSQTLVEALPHGEDIEGSLRKFARRHVTVVTQPHLIKIRRLIIAEADRFPELARTWYEAAPGRAHANLAELFQEIAAQGRLNISDPMLAAEYFNWLVLSIPLNKAMFLGSNTQFSRAALHRYADEAVRIFLAAYGP
ncbi:TetR/AcrR family transcriptional regulator [Phytoactinopolyspora halotolerans]|uniref:TetR/AcrR family transcriptional regulator n=1 Tax=Phytoactinopolyspora halotolerans TaxID=1981512 RepID=A0A6L9S4I0_9ACTN|nr:TetR/AcrR family transcriptional regulator [Phytoactinopolyspora halotolerans]NED99680.1 TetR/AcrR family transcriptional regulator [Phytoactinopolyspora halotolerans]